MTTGASPLLGLALPVTGELSGSWGDVVSDSITSLVDSAIAGTTTLSTDGDVTLTTTALAANQARQAVLLCTGARTAQRTITAPAHSKTYIVINATSGGFAVSLVGAGPTTGVTVAAGESAVIAWNGSDFLKVSNTGGAASFTNVTVSGTTTLSGLTASTALALDGSKNVVSVTNTGSGNNVLATNPTISGVTFSDGTANGVGYLNASKQFTTGSALTFDGTTFNLGNATNTYSGKFITKSGVSDGYAFATDNTVYQYLSAISSGVAIVGTATNHPYSFAINGSEQMRLTSTGLGIGTSSPGYKLDVNGTIRGAGDVISSAANPLFQGSSATGSAALCNNSAGAYIRVYGGSHATRANYTDFINGTSTSTFDSSGNLGIGTSSPTAKLDVNGAALSRLGSGGVALCGDASPDLGFVGYNYYNVSGTETVPQTIRSSWRHRFGNGATNVWSVGYRAGSAAVSAWTEYLTLDSSGNLGLGVTPSAWGSGFKAFQIGARGSAYAGSDASMRLAYNAYYDGTGYKRIAASSASQWIADTDGSFAWFQAGSSTAGTAITFTQAMTLDASGNLGIGTSSPGGKLDVYTDAYRRFLITAPSTYVTRASLGVSAYLESDGGADTLNLNVTSSAGKILFSKAGTEQMRLDSSGNLGLGVTPSGWASSFKVIQIGASGGALNSYSGSGAINMAVNNYYDGTVTPRYVTTNYALYYQQNPNTGQHLWYTAPSGTAGNPITFTQAMTLDASGNLGIGTTSPTFSAGSGIHVYRTTGAAVRIQDSSTDFDILSFSANVNFTNRSNGALVFGTNNTERARIDSSGNLLVGRTAAGLTNAGAGFSKNAGGAYLEVVQGTTGVACAYFNQSNGTGTQTAVDLRYNNTQVGTISVTSVACTYNNLSDHRLKDVIGPVSDSGARIDALKPVNYVWKSAGISARGFLAHEFQSVYPQSVTGEKDAMDEKGKPVYQTMQASTSEVIADLVAEIQSLRARLAALEAK